MKRTGCKISKFFLVSSPESIKKSIDAHPDIDIYAVSADERLNEAGYTLPGLGDAEKKIFGQTI